MSNSRYGRSFFRYILVMFLILSGLHIMGQSPPATTTGAASGIGSTDATLNGTVNAGGATLNGTVNANNASTTVTFEYGLNTSYGKVVTADQSPVTGSSNTAVSKGLTSLVPNTTYHYRVVATNANDTVYGADMTFTTGNPVPTVTTQAASNVSTTRRNPGVM